MYLSHACQLLASNARPSTLSCAGTQVPGSLLWCKYVNKHNNTSFIDPYPTPGRRYQAVCSGATGHAEAVRFEYDPSKAKYADLVRPFKDTRHVYPGLKQILDLPACHKLSRCAANSFKRGYLCAPAGGVLLSNP